MEKTIRIRVAGVMSDRGKVLLVRHEKNGKRYWLLPGGGVDYGETLEEALEREFLEETSLRVRVGKLLMVSEVVAPDRSRHGIHVTFLVKRLSGTLSVTPDARLRSASYVEWEKVPGLAMFPRIGKALCQARGKKFRGPALFTGNIWVH